jgi:hypothetical protein
MEQIAIAKISHALDAAHRFAHASNFDGCDAGDIDEIIESAKQELLKPKPSIQTLSTYINSVARSLRADQSARVVCLQLDAAMRGANVPTNWENI